MRKEDSRPLHWGLILIGMLIVPVSLLFLFSFPSKTGASAPSLHAGQESPVPSPSRTNVLVPAATSVYHPDLSSSQTDNLVPAPTSVSPPIFMLAIGDTNRISVDSFGSQSNSNSYDASISANSNLIGYDSFATNLISNDTNNRGDVFIYDRLSGSTTRFSITTGGVQGNGDSAFPSLTTDGNYVSFRSSATNLVVGDTNGRIDIFLRDQILSQTTRVSTASDSSQANGDSLYSVISPDGSTVAFHSNSTNLVAGDTNGVWDVFTKNLGTNQTTRVSVSSGGVQGNGDSLFPTISQDGRYVAFHSIASNLVPGDTLLFADVFIHDRVTGQTERVSVSSAGVQGDGSSFNPSISFDGRYIAFESAATNLVSGDTNNATDIFLRDVLLGTTRRVSLASDLTQANSWSGDVSIASDAHYLAYHSNATNLVVGDTNNFVDVFVYNTQTGQTMRVSLSSGGIEGNGPSVYSSIAGNGRFVAFGSSATNLVVNDTNGSDDIFLNELEGNTPTPSLTPTKTNTPSPTNTNTSTPSPSPTNTSTPTNTSSSTPSPTNTFTPTPTNTATITLTPSDTPTPTNTYTPTNTPTITATWTPSLTPTNTVSPTISPTPSNTVSPTPSLTWTPSNTPTVSPTATLTFTPSLTPSDTPTPTLTPSFTPSLTYTPSLTPTNTLTPTPSYTPTSTYTPTNTLTPSMTPSPTNTPTITPSVTVIPPVVYKIEGKVTDALGNPLSGVFILVNTQITTQTDQNGTYRLYDLVYGTYEISASLDGYIFSTGVQMPLILPPSHLHVDFMGVTGQTYTITGQVRDILGKALPGVSVMYGIDQGQAQEAGTEHLVISEIGGTFRIRGLYAGKYVISLSMKGYNFTPARRIVSVPPNATGQVFVAVKASISTYTVSGKVMDTSGQPLAGVTVSLGSRLSAVSDSAGNYVLRDVPQGTYTISANRSGYLFTPAFRSINVPRDLSNQDFSGMKQP